MGKETKEEREFSENIERLLAGEEVKAGEDMGEEYRTAINFAQKLIELRDEPSPHFKDRLKRQLLSKLAEQEAEATRKKERANRFWEALRNLVPQNPVWRTATATVVVAVLVIVVLWGSGTFTQAPEQLVEREPVTEMASPTGKALTTSEVLEATVSEAVVAPFGEEVKIELVFRNVSSESVEVTPFPPAIQITQAESGEVIRSLAEGNERREISPSGALNFTLVWDQLDDNRKQVVPGRYSLSIIDVTIYKATEPKETHLDFRPLTDITIQSP
jgi:hypothetical protein